MELMLKRLFSFMSFIIAFNNSRLLILIFFVQTVHRKIQEEQNIKAYVKHIRIGYRNHRQPGGLVLKGGERIEEG